MEFCQSRYINELLPCPKQGTPLISPSLKGGVLRGAWIIDGKTKKEQLAHLSKCGCPMNFGHLLPMNCIFLCHPGFHLKTPVSLLRRLFQWHSYKIPCSVNIFELSIWQASPHRMLAA
jgi:hypothetical protein